ncbi:hypothetical protein ACFY3N_09615 [Streptomyces sp. NPDC000348]|uniref:hypothetical protein n=1 Tax=Streptomyces sp. NPDC000348 TaxID=3364538 RepID=UPI00368D3066
MTRVRPAALGKGCLLWAALALPAVCADRLGLNEPRPLWQRCAGLVVLAAATAVARHRPTTAFGLTAALSLASAPALFGVSYGPALGVFALLLGLRAPRTAPAALCFAAVACAGLRPGTPVAEVERVLPDRHAQDPPAERAPAPPEGTDCRYYRASGELFVSVDHFRLCFDDRGRLAAKNVIPRVGTSGEAREE